MEHNMEHINDDENSLVEDWKVLIKNTNDVIQKHIQHYEDFIKQIKQEEWRHKYFDVVGEDFVRKDLHKFDKCYCPFLDTKSFNPFLKEELCKKSYDEYIEYSYEYLGHVQMYDKMLEELIIQNWEKEYEKLLLQLVYDATVSPYHLSKVFTLIAQNT